MASVPNQVLRFGHKQPSLAFELETNGTPPAQYSAKFIYDLDRILTWYLRNEGVELRGGSTHINHIAVGSLTGELVAIAVDHLPVARLRDVIAAFIPTLQGIIDVLMGEAALRRLLHPEESSLLHTACQGIVNKEIQGLVINIPGGTINSSIIIDSDIAPKILDAIYMQGFKARTEINDPVIDKRTIHTTGKTTGTAKFYISGENGEIHAVMNDWPSIFYKLKIDQNEFSDYIRDHINDKINITGWKVWYEDQPTLILTGIER